MGKDMELNGFLEPVEIVCIEGDSVEPNSDDQGIEVKEIKSLVCRSVVSDANGEDAEPKFGDIIDVRKGIESSITVNQISENGDLVSNDRALVMAAESSSEPNVVAVDLDPVVQLDGEESDSPVLVNHSTKSNDEKANLSSGESTGIESPVFVNYGFELNNEAVELNSDEGKGVEFPSPADNSLKSNGVVGDVDGDGHLEAGREKTKPLFSVIHDMGSEPCSDETAKEVPEIETLESESDLDTDEQTEVEKMFKGRGKDHTTIRYNVPEIESADSVNETQQLLAKADIQSAEPGYLDSDGQVDETKKETESPLFVNHGGDGDPISDETVNDVPEIDFLESENKFEQLHAEGDVQNPEDVHVDPSSQVGEEKEKMEPPVSVSDGGGDFPSDDTVNEVLESESGKSFEKTPQLHAEVDSQNLEICENQLKVTESVVIDDDLLQSHCEHTDLSAEDGMTKLKESNPPACSIGASEAEARIRELVMDQMICNLERVMGDSDTVQAENGTIRNDGRTTKITASESAEINPAKYNGYSREAEKICEGIKPNGSSNSFSDDCAPLNSISELDEHDQPLPFENSKKLVSVSDLSEESPIDDTSLPVKDSKFYVGERLNSIDITAYPNASQMDRRVHMNGVMPPNLAVPLIFGSFAQGITINGVSWPLSEGSSASSCSQLEDGVYVNVTASNDGEFSCSEPSSPRGKEVASTSSLGARKVDAEGERKPVYAIMRIPRPIDDNFKEQTRQAQLRVDELTQKRDTINALVQKKQAVRQEVIEKSRAARSELKAARDALLAKRKQIDSIQRVMNIMKTATSVEEHDERILLMQRRLQHETVPLKEEKQLIREINQLKHARDKLSVDIGRQSDLQEVIDRKEEIEEDLMLLEQGSSSLRKELTRTDAHVKSIDEELSKLDKEIAQLRSQVSSANDVRQEAYLHLKSLKQQDYERHTLFYENRRDIQMAHEYSNAKDRAALEQHCTNQVKEKMELWNKDGPFRVDYIRNNEMSTLRRLGTLDGRQLGPGEKRPVLRGRTENGKTSVSRLPVVEKDAALSVSTPELSRAGKPLSEPKAEENTHEEKTNQKSPASKAKKPSKSTVTESTPLLYCKEEGTKPSEEELQWLREGERQKEEEAARLKEKHRQEQIAKAKQAEERKQRRAVKSKARAEERALKEVEQKQKKREERAMKKAAAAAATAPAEGSQDGRPEDEWASSSAKSISETSSTAENEIKEKKEAAAGAAKRPIRSHLMSKATKPGSLVPPPLRKKKRRMQPWIFGTIGTLAIILLAFVLQHFYF